MSCLLHIIWLSRQEDHPEDPFIICFSVSYSCDDGALWIVIPLSSGEDRNTYQVEFHPLWVWTGLVTDNPFVISQCCRNDCRCVGCWEYSCLHVFSLVLVQVSGVIFTPVVETLHKQDNLSGGRLQHHPAQHGASIQDKTKDKIHLYYAISSTMKSLSTK